MPQRYFIEKVTKIFADSVVANAAISLHIPEGTIFGLLGPNGAGKSTLVQQMVGLLRPDEGRIFYDGHQVVPGATMLKHKVAYLSQRPLALFDLTVREAILYTGRLRGMDRAQVALQMEKLLAQLNLESCADRIVAQLSGGQHRLVGLATALIGDAETLVLDEPTNELDPQMRRIVWSLLRERCHKRGGTVILVTHNALEAEQVLERLAVLVDGRVVACGTPGAIKSQVDRDIRVELTFRDEPEIILAQLRSLGNFLRPLPRQVVLAAPREQARHLIDRVLEIVSLEELDDFRVLTPTLEDVYLRVAGHGMQGHVLETVG